MIIPVEVVLPWAPATATRRRPRVSQARATARWTTGTPAARAARNSGLSSAMAPVTTRVSAEPMLAASCPIVISMPCERRDSTVSVERMSDPVTRCPAAEKRSAMPLIPAPPIPTKCTWVGFSGTGWEKSDLITTATLPLRAGLFRWPRR